MHDELDIPEFLNRKVNPIEYSEKELHVIKRFQAKTQKLVWPKKRNWRKIEARRREQERKEGAALLAGTIVRRKGQ